MRRWAWTFNQEINWLLKVTHRWFTFNNEKEIKMGDKGKKDKGRREEQKKGKQTPKEKRKQKKDKKKSIWEN